MHTGEHDTLEDASPASEAVVAPTEAIIIDGIPADAIPTAQEEQNWGILLAEEDAKAQATPFKEGTVAAFIKRNRAARRKRISAAIAAALGVSVLSAYHAVTSESKSAGKQQPVVSAPMAPAALKRIVSRYNAQIKLVVAGLNSPIIPVELPAPEGETYLGNVTFSAPGKLSQQHPCRIRRLDEKYALASCDDLSAAEKGPILTLTDCKRVEKELVDGNPFH